jgi:hypothetical protein
MSVTAGQAQRRERYAASMRRGPPPVDEVVAATRTWLDALRFCQKGRAQLSRLDSAAAESLGSWLGWLFPALPRTELATMVGQVMSRVALDVENGTLDAARADAPGFVFTTLRKLAHERTDPSIGVACPSSSNPDRSPRLLSDIQVLHLLAPTIDASTLRSAIQRAAERGDTATIRVIATWLNATALRGSAPSWARLAHLTSRLWLRLV